MATKSKHDATFEVVERDANGVATKWVARCSCRNAFVGADYYDVDAAWAEHAGAKPMVRMAHSTSGGA